MHGLWNNLGWRGILAAGLLAVWIVLCGVFPSAGALAAPPSDSASATAEPPWPIYRGGPQLHGVADARLPDEPQLLWTFETGGPIQSSAVIGHGRVYIGSDDGFVYAIDLPTGEKAWAFETEGSVEAPPTLHGGRLFVGSNDGFLYCLDADSGELVWKYETLDKIVGAANALTRPSDGRTVVVAGSYDARLHGLDAGTGEPLWQYETDNFINGTPAVDRGRTIFGGCDGFLHIVSVANGTKIKQVEIGAYIASSAALDGRFAYLGHYGNEFIAVDLEAERIVWRYHDRNFPYFGSPAVTDRYVIFGGRDRRLHCVSREDGSAVWTFATRREVNSSPVVAGDRIVVGSDDGRLYIVALDDGRELWSYEIGRPVGSSPAVAEGRIVIGADDGRVYAFGRADP